MSREVLDRILQRSPHEPEFHQAVEEVYLNVEKVIEQNPQYKNLNIFERISEPERIITFRVPWMDDQGNINVNRGYRVQMNSAIGPYKGGLRFHPTVNLSVLKFLAFEQIFKNALTGLPMGGGKGGSDFDPKGKSDAEVMRFTQSFMQELAKHIGHRTDVPAGDIGVGGREIGYLFGMYKKINNEFVGVLTGKGLGWGGSLIRPEATGYGLIYFAIEMLATKGQKFEGKRCLVSGSGNVAQFAMEKIIANGGIPVTASDSSGFIYDKDGIDAEKLEFIKELKEVKRGRIKEYADKYPSAEYHAVEKGATSNPLWSIKAECAFPCATQNEVNVEDAQHMIDNGVMLLAEGANMPTTPEAITMLQKGGVMYAPGKASNAGGVATSGLEMVQNYNGLYWTREDVDEKLRNIMRNIHDTCLKTAAKYGFEGDYMAGANIAGFIKVADAMVAEGIL
ncbi:MAG: NADP-specific glutamate dehydrogenase [Cyclobacteriaceae bacterium]|nr:NADP-specific glutamate dehydrogenase [Cyclobacteriaceae bacterium]